MSPRQLGIKTVAFLINVVFLGVLAFGLWLLAYFMAPFGDPWRKALAFGISGVFFLRGFFFRVLGPSDSGLDTNSPKHR